MEGPLPLLNRVQALDPGEDRAYPWCDAYRAAGGHHLGVTTRDGLLTEMEVLGPGLNSRPETEIPLGEGREGGQGDNGVSREMMRL